MEVNSRLYLYGRERPGEVALTQSGLLMTGTLVLGQEVRQEFHMISVRMAQHDVVDPRQRGHQQSQERQHAIAGAAREIIVGAGVINLVKSGPRTSMANPVPTSTTSIVRPGVWLRAPSAWLARSPPASNASTQNRPCRSGVRLRASSALARAGRAAGQAGDCQWRCSATRTAAHTTRRVRQFTAVLLSLACWTRTGRPVTEILLRFDRPSADQPSSQLGA
jgi:hypothetical protein